MTIAIVAIVFAAAGFAAGRVKYAQQLANIKAEVGTLESYVTAEAKSLASAIKAHL